MDKTFLELTDTEQEKTLNYCITEANRANGKQGGAEAQQIDDMKKIIRKYFPKIGADTVVSSFEKGSLGMLGEFYGLNAKTFTQWLRVGYGVEHHPRDFDQEPPSRPDTENDCLSLLDTISEMIKQGKQPEADWVRIYNYLVIRKQASADEFTKYLNPAETQVSAEKHKEKRISEIKIEKSEVSAMAMKIAVCKWIEQHPKPSETLAPLVNETQWRKLRHIDKTIT